MTDVIEAGCAVCKFSGRIADGRSLGDTAGDVCYEEKALNENGRFSVQK